MRTLAEACTPAAAGEDFLLGAYDFTVPEQAIAQWPARPRDSARLMCLDRRTGATSHHLVPALAELLVPGDLLVVNATGVLPARLRVLRPNGGGAELLFVRPVDGPVEQARRWRALARPARALAVGSALALCGREGDRGLALQVVAREGAMVEVVGGGPLWDLMRSHGEVPLPPYISRPQGPSRQDAADYQTPFAREPGAAAAPTASLHFTPALLRALDRRGVSRAEIVLHVGPGTFLPVRADADGDVRGHSMHAEAYQVGDAACDAVAAVRRRGGRVVAVGTTALRALETWAATGERSGWSRLFVLPGHRFRVVDALVTNFHLPKSTLVMLVAALAGRRPTLAAYREALAHSYRFFSFGDAMLVA